MTEWPPTRAVLAVDGAPVPAAYHLGEWGQPIVVTSEGAKPALNFKVESLAAKVTATLDRRALDLIKIASACYAADQRVRRGGPIDVHRAGWRRELAVCIPVSDPDFWASEEPMRALTEVLSFATEDVWHFVFTERPKALSQLRLDVNERELLKSPDSVILFSGGTDSLCALVDAVAGRDARPVVVSHRTASYIDTWQTDLLDDVRKRFPDWPLPHMSFWIHSRGQQSVDSSQRTRGFLFASLGTAVAGQVGLPLVQLPDNGYVSINPAISAQIVGALASRGTHPTFLRLFNRLATLVFPGLVTVTNPLADQTRAETLGILTAHEVPELVSRTHSCGNYRSPKQSTAVPHCGRCSQCIDRRFAVIAAGLEDYDRADRYGVEIFAGHLPEGQARTVALSYAGFARTTERLSSGELYFEHPELVQCLDPEAKHARHNEDALIALLKRHSAETIEVIAEMIRRNATEIAQGTLVPTSLLGLLLSTSDPRAALAWVQQPAATPLIPDEVNPPVPEAENLFRHRFGLWHVQFHGEKGAFGHAKGMTQISLLLDAQGQELDIEALARCEVLPYRPPAQMNGLWTGSTGTIDERLARLGLDDLKRQEGAYDEQIATARAKGQTAKVAELTEELKALKKYRRAQTRLGGGPRVEGGTAEPARKAVSKNINACLKRFERDMQGLFHHFDRFLHRGIPPSYKPEPWEHWRVER